MSELISPETANEYNQPLADALHSGVPELLEQRIALLESMADAEVRPVVRSGPDMILLGVWRGCGFVVQLKGCSKSGLSPGRAAWIAALKGYQSKLGDMRATVAEAESRAAWIMSGDEVWNALLGVHYDFRLRVDRVHPGHVADLRSAMLRSEPAEADVPAFVPDCEALRPVFEAIRFDLDDEAPTGCVH